MAHNYNIKTAPDVTNSALFTMDKADGDINIHYTGMNRTLLTVPADSMYVILGCWINITEQFYGVGFKALGMSIGFNDLMNLQYEAILKRQLPYPAGIRALKGDTGTPIVYHNMLSRYNYVTLQPNWRLTVQLKDYGASPDTLDHLATGHAEIYVTYMDLTY